MQERIIVFCIACKPGKEVTVALIVASPADGRIHDGALTEDQRQSAQTARTQHLAFHRQSQFHFEPDIDPSSVQMREQTEQ